MKFDHVGLKVASLEQQIRDRAGARAVDSQTSGTATHIREVPAGLANTLWGSECGALRVWFAHDATGNTEYFEQLDQESAPIAETHLCFTVDSISDVFPWWQSAGFQMLSEKIVEIGSKRTVMLRSSDGVVVQLVTDLGVNDGGE